MINGLFHGCIVAVSDECMPNSTLNSNLAQSNVHIGMGAIYKSSFESIDLLFDGSCSTDLISYVGVIKMQTVGFQTQSVLKIFISWQDLGWKLVFPFTLCNHIGWLVWPQTCAFRKRCAPGCWHRCLPTDVNSIPLTVLPKWEWCITQQERLPLPHQSPCPFHSLRHNVTCFLILWLIHLHLFVFTRKITVPIIIFNYTPVCCWIALATPTEKLEFVCQVNCACFYTHLSLLEVPFGYRQH